MKLSVLDQSPISRGSNARTALKNTLKLTHLTEELGFARFWVAEHHNTNGLASTSPEVLISHIASQTSKIRVGSGGVLLPQYSPFKVAENFKTLEALFPNRIDIGIGRSPGGSSSTRLALTDSLRKSLNEFPRQLRDLKGYLTDTLPEGHPYAEVKATPITDSTPEMWLLGTSHRGARVAAENGIAFTFGHFINPSSGQRATEEYFSGFTPSLNLSRPKMNVCIFVVCADTEHEAEELAISQDIWLLNIGKGSDSTIPSIVDAKRTTLSLDDQDIIQQNRKRTIIGTPDKVKEELSLLSEIYRTEEFMVITNTFDFEARKHSYKLLAEAILGQNNL
ncbi:LLM class flavin-dependent oxidoreductase [Peribacillus saganii]|uniref:LLM class flavin-dependent oxidoreductase n=1 Tax=Peribacillus saganii TaxID=2303992 RepID=A0A372LRT7_9BACI|nr:LLM class flavin-dependent oxidoreductase [Peribacillus saganii]RFU70915.1 LLM class flavin-dependent oxidoreductase [Peribacillus saganii]